MLGKIVVVGPVVNALRVLRVIVFVVQLHLRVLGVGGFADLVQIARQFVRTDHVNVVIVGLFVFVQIIDPTHHVDVQIGNGVGEGEHRTKIGIIF